MPRVDALLQRHLLHRPGLSFVVLGIAFFAFAVCTLNLGMLLSGNLKLLGAHGWQAAMEGALQQLMELVVTGYAGMAAYVVLKTCEQRCVRWLSGEG